MENVSDHLTFANGFDRLFAMDCKFATERWRGPDANTNYQQHSKASPTCIPRVLMQSKCSFDLVAALDPVEMDPRLEQYP